MKLIILINLEPVFLKCPNWCILDSGHSVFLIQVTYRVIQVSDGQIEGQTDGTTAVSVVTGFPTAQPVTQVTNPAPYLLLCMNDVWFTVTPTRNTLISPLSHFLVQAVFSQSEGLEGDGNETHYTYYPATITDGTPGTMVTSVQAPDSLLGQNTPTGELVCLVERSSAFK